MARKLRLCSSQLGRSLSHSLKHACSVTAPAPWLHPNLHVTFQPALGMLGHVVMSDFVVNMCVYEYVRASCLPPPPLQSPPLSPSLLRL
jgi:hypothetical protein